MEHEKLCRVCGDEAIAFNFNGLSCESCKAFFRRNAFKENNLSICQNEEGNCTIDIKTRKYCKFCRMNKCLEIGMKKELVEYYKNKWTLEKQNTINFIELRNRQLSLQKTDRHYIDEISQAMEIAFIDEKSVHLSGHSKGLEHALTNSAFYVKLIIKFCNNFHAFKCLKREDQLGLLKTAFHDVLSIRFAFLYSGEIDGFYMFDNELYESTVLVKFGTESDQFREFKIKMQKLMENDVSILNLIVTMVLFKSHHNTSCPEFVRYHYYIYTQLLNRYLTLKYAFYDSEKPNRIFTELLAQIDQMSKARENVQMLHLEVGLSNLPQITIELYNLVDMC